MTKLLTYNFQGAVLALIRQAGLYFVACRPVAEAIGLTWQSQFELINRDEVLKSTVSVIRTVAQDDKSRELLCLPLEYLNGCLFKVSTRRIKDARVKECLIRYQRECYQALYEHFFGTRQKEVATRSIESKSGDDDRRAGFLSGFSVAAILLQYGVHLYTVELLVWLRDLGLTQPEAARAVHLDLNLVQGLERHFKAAGISFETSHGLTRRKENHEHFATRMGGALPLAYLENF